MKSGCALAARSAGACLFCSVALAVCAFERRKSKRLWSKVALIAASTAAHAHLESKICSSAFLIDVSRVLAFSLIDY